jgi:hypothetical protein
MDTVTFEQHDGCNKRWNDTGVHAFANYVLLKDFIIYNPEFPEAVKSLQHYCNCMTVMPYLGVAKNLR